MSRTDTGENGKSKIVYVELLTYKLVKGISYSFISILNMDGCFFYSDWCDIYLLLSNNKDSNAHLKVNQNGLSTIVSNTEQIILVWMKQCAIPQSPQHSRVNAKVIIKAIVLQILLE